MRDADENVQALFEMGKISEPSISAAKEYCKNSKIGDYACLVQTRLGWSCDLCLEKELLELWSQGVHTINSCCGHGNNGLKTILVIGDNSREKMESLDYEFLESKGNNVTMWRAKSETISEIHDNPELLKGVE